MSNGYLRYRIGVINDHKGVTAFIDYQQYMNGEVKIWNVSKCSTKVDYQRSEDAIYVFLNFKKIAVCKTNAEAVSVINDLLNKAPHCLMEYKDYLI